MNSNTNRPVPIERASAASLDHIDEELRRYDDGTGSGQTPRTGRKDPTLSGP